MNRSRPFFFKKTSLLFSGTLVLVVGLLVVFSGSLKTRADTTPVYVQYASATAGAKTIYVYQKISNVPSNVQIKWARWTLAQYTGGNNAWTVLNASTGHTATLSLETTRNDFTYSNGTGDSGTWVNYAIGNIVAKRRDTATGYVPYSATASYTVTADSDEVYLGVMNNSGVNGTIRVKINGTISTVGDLDSNGLYNEAAHGSNNTDTQWIKVASTVHTGDVITIETKDDVSPNVRHVITGLRFYTDNNPNPGDSGWAYVNPTLFLNSDNGSSQAVAIRGSVTGQTDTFMFGVAHKHEYNGSIMISVDGTPYVLDTDLTAGQIVSGSNVTAQLVSTGYGNTQGTDDFGTMTQTVAWQGSTHTQHWQLNFTKDYNAAVVYTSMFPADYSSKKIFRYTDLGNNFLVASPNGATGTGTTFPQSPVPSKKYLFEGGSGNLQVTMETTSNVTQSLMQVDNTHQKAYFENSDLQKTWHSGETMDSGTTTFTLAYQTPDQIAWIGKTLYIPRSLVIDTSADNLPFNGQGVVVKSLAGAGIGLTFNEVAPSKTYFTSQNDTVIGAREFNNSGVVGSGQTFVDASGNPQIGDWAGITVSGAITANDNVFEYATTGLTLTGNALGYNNSFYKNTTGINAASGSIVEDNAFSETVTPTTGSGSFDYDAFSNNTEVHGVSGDPLFNNPADGDFKLRSNSPLIDAGYDTGITTDMVGNARYDDFLVANTGGGSTTYYDIGAAEYIGPTGPTFLSVTQQPSFNSATITWRTDQSATSQVSYGTSLSYGSTTDESDTLNRVTDHSVTISGLEQCTLYHYQVISVGTNGTVSTSGDNTFTTAGCPGILSGGGPIPPQYQHARSQTSMVTPPVVQPVQVPATSDAVGPFTSNLSVGMKNAKVTLLQTFLGSLEGIYPEKLVTGYYGSLTKKAVQRLQLKYGVVSSSKDLGYGRVGPKTRATLNALYAAK